MWSDFELKVGQIRELQSEIDLRTLAEQRVEYLISKGMVNEAFKLLRAFEKEGVFDE